MAEAERQAMIETDRQVMVGVREAAQLAGVSTKQIRKWVAARRVRAELRDSKFGPTWFIEASSLPLARPPLEAGRGGVGEAYPGPVQGSGAEVSTGGTGAVQALVAMLSDLQRRHEGAVARLGQLEGEREQRLALEERARSLVEREAAARAEAETQRRLAEESARAEVEARAQAERERHGREEEAARAQRLTAALEAARRQARQRAWLAGTAGFAALSGLVMLAVILLGR